MTHNPLIPTTPSTPGNSATAAPGAANGARALSAPSTSKSSPVDPIRLLRQHARLLVATAVGGIVLGVITWQVLKYLAPEFTTTSQLAVMAPPEEIYNTNQTIASGEGTLTFIQNQIIRIKSDEILNDALKDAEVRKLGWFKSFAPDDPNSSESDTVNALRVERARQHLVKRALNVTNLPRTSLISVELKGSKTSELPVVLDTILSVYMKKLRLEGDTSSDDLRRVFVQERTRAEDDLKTIQDNIRQFTIDNNLPELRAQGNEASIAYQLLAEQDAKMRIAAIAALEAYKAMASAQQSGTITHTPEDLAMVERDPAVAGRDERIRSLREEREVALYRMGPEHRYIQDIDRRIAATQLERKREMERLLIERDQVNVAEAKKQADGLEAQIVANGPKLEEARTRMRDLSLKIRQYELLSEQATAAAERRDRAEKVLNEVRLRTNRPDFIRIRIQQRPTLPELTFPTPLVIIPLVTLLSLGVVGGLIYVRELLDQRVKSPADVLALPALELVGVLPESTDDPDAPAKLEGIVAIKPTGLMAEAFRQLRTTLTPQMDRRGYKSLMVVSPQPQSGVSMVVNNLAISMALAGRRTVIVDANLRRPNQHQLAGLPASAGLSEVLRGQTSLDNALIQRPPGQPDLLTIGQVQDTPPELLESPAFRSLLNQLESRYDIILIDAPPALLTSDSQMIAKHVDAILMVLRAMSDKRGMIGRMIRQFTGLRADMLGAVLNRARSSAGGYFRESYQEFYRYQKAPAATGKLVPAASAAATRS